MKEMVSGLSSSVLPSSVWTLREEATSPLSQQGGVYSEAMEGVGSAHSAGLGPWDSSAGLSIFSLGPPCGRAWLSLW